MTMRISQRADVHRLRTSYTLPSSPTIRSPSSSSSEFEFAIGSDDHQRASFTGAELTPADDLFYKGKILPLQPTPRLSMVKSLFFANSSSSASSSANSRRSTGSSSSSDAATCESPPRPSFVADLEEEKDLIIISEPMAGQSESQSQSNSVQKSARKSKSFSFGKISSVFKKEPRSAAVVPMMSKCGTASGPTSASSSSSARDVMKKYMKKVKPLYEKMARRQRVLERESSSSARDSGEEAGIISNGLFSDTFSGNLMKVGNGQGVVMSCPASIRSSPCHSGALLGAGPTMAMTKKDSSSEELQSAIQGAIAHCKNSMLRNKS